MWIVYKSEEARRRGGESFRVPASRVILLFLPPLITFGLTLAFTGAILLGYNALRSGNPLQTGYDLTLFSPNILLGLYKLLLSPLRGFFIYSPILILSLPGWWLLRKTYPAEAWLFAGLTGVTLGLFSAWSSGEGLSWGSRFLVPIVPFFAICLAPIVEGSGVRGQGSGNRVAGSKVAGKTEHASRLTPHASRFTPHASTLHALHSPPPLLPHPTPRRRHQSLGFFSPTSSRIRRRVFFGKYRRPLRLSL